MRILAVDPGVTTGFALYNKTQFPEVRTWQDKLDVYGIHDTLRTTLPNVIVYEKFTPPSANRYKVELFSVQVIGVLRLWVQTYVLEEYSHTASAAKGLWTDTKIKRLTLWVPGQDHGMDALRHLLYHLTVTRKDESWLKRAR